MVELSARSIWKEYLEKVRSGGGSLTGCLIVTGAENI